MDIQDQQLNVQVAVRIRPLNQKEIKEASCLKSDRNSIILPQNGKTFTFDHVFDQDTSQDQIFQCCVTNLILRCFEGYNSTILAYGQTGSGKTYTMGTSAIDQFAGQNMNLLQNQSDCGMIPRVVYFLFEEIEKRKQEQDIKIIQLERDINYLCFSINMSHIFQKMIICVYILAGYLKSFIRIYIQITKRLNFLLQLDYSNIILYLFLCRVVQ